MLLKALRPWTNQDYEGHVEPGQLFEANDYRANELIRAGLAMATTDEKLKIKVPADEPPAKRRRG